MPQKNAKELRGLPLEELTRQIAETQATIAQLRLKSRQGVIEQPHRIRQLRREVARAQTVVGELARQTAPATGGSTAP